MAEIDPRFGRARCRGGGLPQHANGGVGAAVMQRDRAEKVERVGMAGLADQHAPRRRLRLEQPSGAKQRIRLAENLLRSRKPAKGLAHGPPL